MILKNKVKNMKKKTYILAEMASSHEGDLKTAESIIRSSARAKADGILFQMMDLHTYIVPSDIDWDDTVSFYMNQEKWAELIEKTDELGLDIWANIYDLASLHFCKDKKIKGFKLHSSNLDNEDLVKEMVKTKKEILLSVGGLEEEEIESALKLVYSVDKKAKVCLMYGLQNFPTNPEGVNLNFIKKMAKEFNLPWGYQDHSSPTSAASTYLSILAVAEGASIIEKHITTNRSLKGQDYQAALNPDEFTNFVNNIRLADNIMSKDPYEFSLDELKYREYKTLVKVVAKENIKKGETFSKDNITVMRAKAGEISGKKIKLLMGKKSQRDYKKFDTIERNEIVKVGLFITARLKSTRLPLKAIKPILGKPMIGWMIERLKRCNIKPLVVMTSTNPQDDPLIEIAKKYGVESFRGSEQDVLARMNDCAEKFNVDLIISVTADDPLKEPIFIDKMVQKYMYKKFDFCKIEGLPNGCESYAVSRTALKKVCSIKDTPETEIWGPYFWEPGIFKCETIDIKDQNILRPNYRISVDTPEDFKVVSSIFSILLKKKEYFNVYDICNLLDERPDLVSINAKIEQRKAPAIKLKKKI